MLACAALARSAEPEAIIDIHQHTNYCGRTDEQLIAHQRRMGSRKRSFYPPVRNTGLEASCRGNDLRAMQEQPKAYVFFANEVPIYLRRSK